MRHSLRSALVLVVVVVFSGNALAATIGPTGQSVPGEVVMKVRSSASAADISALERIADADKSKRIARLDSGSLWRMHSRSKSAEALAAALANNPNVEYAEPNFVVRLVATPNDTSYAQLWGLKNTGQSISGRAGAAGADIDAELAWNVTTGSSNVVVGVVDTGIDYTHPDLADNMWVNPGGKGKANCAAGTFGYNAITDTCDPRDDHDHGTHVAGTIGATGNNARGIAGVNWDVSLMGLKFITAQGYGTTADAIAAIDFAVEAKIGGVNIRVLSNSWGGGPFSKALLDVINRANEHDILFVAAAGNDGANNDTYPHYPSNYSTPNMISVAATDNRDIRAWFSNYGRTTVHLGAPGVSVLSTIAGNSYAYFSGTSMATPHVSGVAALVLAHTPSLTTAQVKSAILDNVDPIASMNGITVTGGRLNAARALGVPGAPDFSMSVAPVSRTVTRGGSASYAITIAPANGFSGTVNLSATNLPAGATATFTPPSATTSSTLVVTTTASTPLTTTTLHITGTSGALTRTLNASLTTVSTPALSACPGFTVSSFSASSGVAAVAIGDFNGDGNNDYAAAERDLNRVAIRLAGSGTFVTSGSVGVGKIPLGIVAADLNGDGRIDLATANSGTHDVSVAYGNGDGSFASATQYAAGTSPFAVTAGDFNADGRMDLAVGNNGSTNVSVLLGQNGGTFAAAVHYAAGSGPFGVTPADFDRDGKLDLAVANFNSDSVSILRGNGDGSFQAPAHFAAGDAPSAVAAADLDRDGKLDLAVSNYQSGNVSVLAGNGNGTFAAAVHFTVGRGPYGVAAGDLTGDGIADLVTANGDSSTVSFLRGTGNGSFLAPISIGYLSSEPAHILIGELTGDAKPDVLVAHSYSGAVSLLRNTGDCSTNCGTLAAAAHYIAGATPGSVATGDFNRDGAPDIATVNHVGNSVSISLGNGNGIFAAGVTVAAGSAPRGIAVADVNRDGRLDLAVGSSASNKVLFFSGNGDGTFATAVEYAAGTTPRDVAIGDFDRDGALDLAVATGGADSVSILFGNGNGTFDAPVSYGTGDNPESVAVGDVNGDGRADLAVANSGSGNVSILLGNADGTFQTAVSYGTGTTSYAVVAADLNRDGDLDLAVVNAGSNDVSVLLGNGDGTFGEAVEYAVGSAPYTLTAADLNDDGQVDLATANGGAHNVSVLFAIDSGVFNAAVNSNVFTSPLAIANADFNRDGKPDLVVANSGSANISVLLNTCPVPDLTVTKSHAGTFTQGQSGATYTITVTNSGAAATSAPVTVTDTLPGGLSATAMSGTGWACTVSRASCTRSDALAGGASYPPITLTVRVAGNAAASVTNRVAVVGGGEMNSVNNTASDPTTIAPATDIVVSKTHGGGAFTQGSMGRTYTISVRNLGGLAASGTVTVTDTLPAGLTATAVSGTGWSCTLGSLTCTRSDALAGGSNYPPIIITVNVATDAPSSVTNTVTVSGGSDSNTGNNTAFDPTVIWSAQSCGGLGAPTYRSVGWYATGMAVADFNADGKQDIAVASHYSDRVDILLGTGTGSFGTPAPYSVADSPRDAAAADIDLDGDIDLVVGGQGGHVSVLLGNGDGTFGAAVTRTSGSGHLSTVAIGDLNNDGIPDVAVNGYSAYVLLGNGDGTLGPAAEVDTLYTAYHVIIADLDRDGTADLVAATSAGVEVLRGNGDGTFAAPVRYGNFEAIALVAADFNNDGNLDIAATTNYGYYIKVLLGRGDGTLQNALTISSEYGTSSIVAADVNADGRLDLIAGNSSWGRIEKLTGRGDGTFEPTVSHYTRDIYEIAVSDFNGDGKADVAFSTDWYDSVGIMLGGCVDLSITKTHSGNFRGGQTDAAYTISVRNDGPATGNETLTVTDVLPEGLTATSIYGSGWNCTLATLTCERTGTIPSGYALSPINVVVSVSSAAPTSVTNVATLSGGGDTNPANNTASDPTTIVHAPDLTITKSHAGTFAVGQNGVYTITVGNIGTGTTSGTVTVVDTLPAGMSPVSMTGTGWTCDLLGRSCTRSDALGVTQSYPPITLTVSVTSASSSTVTNIATVSGGGDSISSNNTARDPTNLLIAPVIAAAPVTTTQVQVSWNAVAGAKTYEVMRSSHNGAYVSAGTTVSNFFIDTGRAPNTTYLYIVRAIDAAAIGPFSAPDLASTFVFTDDPVSSTTRTRTVHITELRAAVNAVRAAAGHEPLTFSDGVADGAPMLATHIMELRSALNAVRTALGVPTISFTDPGLAGGSIVKAAHINQLRAGVK